MVRADAQVMLEGIRIAAKLEWWLYLVLIGSSGGIDCDESVLVEVTPAVYIY